eukprot:TRINITY_DN19114_c0_g1_i4.p1 TRINITY_DN19114_c0_g1~~TRINITY_DN19114_c0_g1_i4.p1  ORF type:complete len:661 (-),score=121.13 TRINITY_DN19114_c0_g1_i4:112-2094(-)
MVRLEAAISQQKQQRKRDKEKAATSAAAEKQRTEPPSGGDKRKSQGRKERSNAKAAETMAAADAAFNDTPVEDSAPAGPVPEALAVPAEVKEPAELEPALTSAPASEPPAPEQDPAPLTVPAPAPAATSKPKPKPRPESKRTKATAQNGSGGNGTATTAATTAGAVADSDRKPKQDAIVAASSQESNKENDFVAERKEAPKEAVAVRSGSPLRTVTPPKARRRGSGRQAQQRKDWMSATASVESSQTHTEEDGYDPAERHSGEWRVERVLWLNHNCARVRLKSTDLAGMPKSRVQDEVWHVVVVAEFSFFAGKPGMCREFKEEVTRSYTPLSNVQEYNSGRLDLMVKSYPNGKMSQALVNGSPSMVVRLSPPLPIFLSENYRKAGGAVVVSGGSAITVALQACTQILARKFEEVPSIEEENTIWEAPEDGEAPLVYLVNCNRTRPDVIFRDEINALVQAHPTLHVVHCISSGPVIQEAGNRIRWKAGRLSVEALREPAKMGLQAIVSGPPGLCKAAVEIWRQLGRTDEDIRVLDELPDDTCLDISHDSPRPRGRAKRWRGRVRQAAEAAAISAAEAAAVAAVPPVPAELHSAEEDVARAQETVGVEEPQIAPWLEGFWTTLRQVVGVSGEPQSEVVCQPLAAAIPRRTDGEDIPTVQRVF